MVIKTYNPETLEEKETITQITSVIWNRRFYKNGSFEIKTTSDKFEENDIIAYNYNGEIRSGILMKTVENNDGIALSGYDLKGLFNFRYVTALSEYSGTPETIIKTLAEEYLNTGDRTIPGLIIGKNSGSGVDITYTPEAGFLENIYESLGMTNEIGISVEFDLKNIHFNTVVGTDRSELIKFGRRFRNIDKVEYTKDIFNTYNVGYSKDENEAETVTGNAKGMLRRECFSEKNIEDYLKEKAPIETLRAEANDKYKYGVDYFLGDYVSVVKDDIITVKQITEIKEVHEKNGTFILPVFGTEKENPLKKLLKGV